MKTIVATVFEKQQSIPSPFISKDVTAPPCFVFHTIILPISSTEQQILVTMLLHFIDLIGALCGEPVLDVAADLIFPFWSKIINYPVLLPTAMSLSSLGEYFIAVIGLSQISLNSVVFKLPTFDIKTFPESVPATISSL